MAKRNAASAADPAADPERDETNPRLPQVGDEVLYQTKFHKLRPGFVVEPYSDGSVDIQVLTAAHNDPEGSYRRGTMAGSGTAFVERAPHGDDIFEYRFPEEVQNQ